MSETPLVTHFGNSLWPHASALGMCMYVTNHAVFEVVCKVVTLLVTKVTLFLALSPCSSMEAAPVHTVHTSGVCMPLILIPSCVLVSVNGGLLNQQYASNRAGAVRKQQGGCDTVWSSAPSIDCFTLTRQPRLQPWQR